MNFSETATAIMLSTVFALMTLAIGYKVSIIVIAILLLSMLKYKAIDEIILVNSLLLFGIFIGLYKIFGG